MSGGGSGGGGSGTGLDDLAEWACRLTERLPPTDIRRLATAAASGQTGARALRAAASSPILREACTQLAQRLAYAEPAYLAGLLAGAAHSEHRARGRQSLSVVWTGPESRVTSGRLTSAAVVELIGAAHAEILLVSFATQTEPAVSAALGAASERGVSITLLAERHADNPSYTGTATPFPGLDALRLHWPTADRAPGAALHAKIIVIDDRIALVGSANLTSRAMEANLECGILIRGGPQPRAIRDHLTDLYATGRLRRL